MRSHLPDDLGPLEPGLGQLISVLTADATLDELAGEQAALAMFRASAPQAPATHRTPRALARRRLRRPARLAGVAALALAGGLAVAAYAAVLPAPVQHVAYRVLGFAGVPDAHRSAPRSPGHSAPGPGPSKSRPASPPAASRTSPAPGSSGRPASPAPRPGRPGPRPSASRSAAPQVAAQLSVTVAQHRITAGGSDSVTGLLTDDHGRAVPGQPLTLLERPAGQGTWQRAGRATTSANGSAVLTVQDLTANASFVLTGPDGTRSQRVRVIVMPPVSLSVASGPRRRADILTASSPLAGPGDLVVLQVQAGGGWRSLRVHRLSQADQAEFVVKVGKIGRVYRAVLLRTAAHGPSASSPVAVPA
jgi:hypothetical protein